MRNASRVLGIIGSSLSVAFGVLFIVLAALFGSVFSSDAFPDYSSFDGFDAASASVSDMSAYGSLDRAFDGLFTVYYVMGGVIIASAIPGSIAFALVKKKNKTAGVLNIIAAVLALPSTASMVLFILAAVFALRKEKPPAPQMGYMPPPGSYPAGYPYYPPPAAYPPPFAYPPPPAPPDADKTGEEQ
jgi:hypothetical protein